VPENAEVSASASEISARAISQPCLAQAAPLSALRTTARTDLPALSSVRATLPPTWPVMPVIANCAMTILLLNDAVEDSVSLEG
jgi:hypothetical protein